MRNRLIGNVYNDQIRKEVLDKFVPEHARATFCPVPFMQLLLQPNGNISPCCWAQDINFANVKDVDIDQIWNNDLIKKMRHEFLNGNVVACKSKIAEMGCNKYFDRFLDKIEYSEVQSKLPTRFDVRLNGTCNLKCIMCDVWGQASGVYNDTFFWREGPSQLFSQMREIDVLGGEPFVQSDTFKLIDQVLDVNNNCSWAFSTNANFKCTNKMMNYLNKISIRWIQVSLDSISKSTYPKLRRKGNLKRALETTGDLIELCNTRFKQKRPIKFMISMCVQQLNWQEMFEFFQFATSINVIPVFQYAYGPNEISLSSLPIEKRKEVIGFIENKFSENNIGFVYPILNALRASLVQ